MSFRPVSQIATKILAAIKRGIAMLNSETDPKVETKRPKSKKPNLREIDIVVTKIEGTSGADPKDYIFAMEDGDGKPIEPPILNFDNKGLPGFIVIFNLVEGNQREATGCQFLPDPDEAMWVQWSDLLEPPCPSAPCSWNQFRAIDVVKNDQEQVNRALIVSNRNDYKKRFSFTLRFEIPGCKGVAEYDPVGNNENGGD